MGRTIRRNDRWKKDRRDRNFRKSKKFKTVQHGHIHPPNKIIEKPTEEDYDLPLDNP